MKKRLFIETDVLQKEELHSAQFVVENILEEKGIKCCEDVFDEIKDFAWHNAEEAWECVKRADEIYGDSALVPLCGVGTYTGAPVVMNVMMQKAINEGIENKSLYFLRSYDNIWWNEVDYDLIKKCFVKNDLFTLESDEKGDHQFIQVDISKLEEKY